MKKRSLFAAVAMLIVSAIVLTSATYAWFAASQSASVGEIYATVTNSDGSIFLEPTTYALTADGVYAKAQAAGQTIPALQARTDTVASLTAPALSLSTDNYNPFPTKLNPISLRMTGNASQSQWAAIKASFDSVNFNNGGSVVQNKTISLGQVTDPETGVQTDQLNVTEGDFIHYGFKVQYRGVTGSSQYVRIKPTLKSGGPDFGYVLVRVKPVVKGENTGTAENPQYQGSTAETYTDFLFAYDRTGITYPDQTGKQLYQPLQALTGPIPDDQVTTDSDGFVKAVVDATDSKPTGSDYTLGAFVLPAGVCTSGDWIKNPSDSTAEFQVIESGINVNQNYNAEVEVFIWAEGNDPDCTGNVSNKNIGVSFDLELVGNPG